MDQSHWGFLSKTRMPILQVQGLVMRRQLHQVLHSLALTVQKYKRWHTVCDSVVVSGAAGQSSSGCCCIDQRRCRCATGATRFGRLGCTWRENVCWCIDVPRQQQPACCSRWPVVGVLSSKGSTKCSTSYDTMTVLSCSSVTGCRCNRKTSCVVSSSYDTKRSLYWCVCVCVYIHTYIYIT